MKKTSSWALRVLVGAAAVSLPSVSEASGTLFMVEVQGGLGEAAYSGASPGLAYGLSAGTTVKFKSFPVRWYLLGTVMARNTAVDGRHLGVEFAADRRELDLFVAQRTVIPIWRYVRLYAETGIGQRIVSQTIRRGQNQGELTASSNGLLLVLGLGLQARLTELFSVGLRGEIMPLDVEADLASFAADLQPESNRLALFAQVGIHF